MPRAAGGEEEAENSSAAPTIESRGERGEEVGMREGLL
jgi:hypothetical protein